MKYFGFNTVGMAISDEITQYPLSSELPNTYLT